MRRLDIADDGLSWTIDRLCGPMQTHNANFKHEAKGLIRTIGILTAILLLLPGCAITRSGEGFDMVDDNDYARALPLLEAGAREDKSKAAAVMASFLYLSDYQIPRDLDKAREYYELSKRLPYDRWNQYLDYYTPLAKARIQLHDDVQNNDTEATDILRGDRYSEYRPALLVLAKAYAFGIGVEKDTQIAKLLFARALDNDSEVYSAHSYAWFLAVHPDESFRDGPLALELMKDVMEDEEEAERASTMDTMAAVLAENGQFERAVQTQRQAIERLIEDSEDYPRFTIWKSEFQCRLNSYKQRLAWHFQSDEVPFGIVSESPPCLLSTGSS